MSENPKDCVDRELCHQMMCRLEKNWNQRFEDAATAINLARETIEHRLSGMNELREQINRERGTFVNRELFDRIGRELEMRVRELEQWRNEMLGRMWLIGAAVFTIQAVLVVVVFLRK